MTTIADVSKELIKRRGLSEFVKESWSQILPDKLHWNWHLDEICAHLQACTDGRIKNLLINVPPGCSKTLLTTVFWPAWAWTLDPASRWITVSYDVRRLCTQSAEKMIALVKSPWYVQRWGDILETRPGLREFHTTSEGWRYSTSVRGPMTGYHTDVLIVDDPIKPDACTPVELEFCEGWWSRTTQSRFRDQRTACKVVIMQRLHEADLAGVVLREGDWTHLRLPAYYEADNPCYTKIGGDPRTVEGELLGEPRVVGEEALLRLRKKMGPRDFAAQYQQRPSPVGGAVFRRDWFQYYRLVPPRFDQQFQTWDCAFKGTDTSDFVVGQVWGVSGGQYYLLDQVRERLDFPATVSAIRALTRKWPKCVSKLVEDKANGSAIVDTLKKEIPGLIAVQPEGGKEARANAVAPLFESGSVLFPEGAPWLDDLEHELLSFPAGRNDDQVDALSQGLSWVYRRHSSYAAAMAGARKIFGPRLA